MALENVKIRYAPVREAHRKLPRFDVYKEYAAEYPGGIGTVVLRDLSVEFCAVQTVVKYPELLIRFGSDHGHVLQCVLDGRLTLRNKTGCCIFRILNSREEISNDFLKALIIYPVRRRKRHDSKNCSEGSSF